MEIVEVVTLIRQGVFQVLLIASPVLVIAVGVGLIISIFQATTTIQDQTLTFVPKIFAILILFGFLSGWMFSTLSTYTTLLFQTISEVTR